MKIMIYKFKIPISKVFLLSIIFFGCQRDSFNLSIKSPLPIPPIAPQIQIYNLTTTDPSAAPFVSFSGGYDRSGLGLKSYQFAIGSETCLDDIVPWENANATGLFGFNAILNVPLQVGKPYFFSSRSADNFDQIGKSLCLDVPFYYSTTGWKNKSYLKPNNPQNAFFGYDVAIDGDTIVVGAVYESTQSNTISAGATAPLDTNLSQSGAVYVFRRVAGDWIQEAHIKAVNSDIQDHFGYKVALSGDTIAVAAPGEASNLNSITNGATASADNSLANSGAVYIYRRSAGIWSQEAYIKSFNTAGIVNFGRSLSLDQDTLVVGVPADSTAQNSNLNGAIGGVFDFGALESGAAFVFKRSGVNWDREAYLKPSNNSAGNQFGTSVSVYGDTIAVGAPTESSSQNYISNGATASSDHSLTDSGAAYIFQRTGVNWAQQAYLKPNNPKSSAKFGLSISLSLDKLAVGSPFELNSGSVHVFERQATTWSQVEYIKASNAETDDQFGASISMRQNLLVVGAPKEDSQMYTIENGPIAPDVRQALSNESGAGYIFEFSTGRWRQSAYIKNWNANQTYEFGYSMATDGISVIGSSPNDCSNQNFILNDGTSSVDASLCSAGAVNVFEN